MEKFFTELKEFINNVDAECSQYTTDYFEDLETIVILKDKYEKEDIKAFIGSSLYTLETLLNILNKSFVNDINVFKKFIDFLKTWNNIYNKTAADVELNDDDVEDDEDIDDES